MTQMHYDEAEQFAVEQFAHQNDIHMDSKHSLYAAQELEHVKTKIYERKTAAMNGLRLIPQSNDNPEHVETIKYEIYDQVGMAQVISNYADDLPRSDVSKVKKTAIVQDIGAAYGYSVNELKTSTKMGTKLPQSKGNAARKSVEVKLNQIAMVGDADYGIHGMVTHPNIGVTVLSGQDWTDPNTTAETVLADLEKLYASVYEVTNGVHLPNKLILASKLYTAAKNKRLANSNGKTVLKQFLEDYPNLTAVSVPEFNKVNSKKLAFIGEFAEENMAHEMVMPFKQLPAQARNLELVVPCIARTAGVVVNYPMAFSKAEI